MKFRSVSIVLLIVAVFGLSLVAVSQSSAGSSNTTMSLTGLSISPVPLSIKSTAVGIGSYIVNARSTCNDCHTCPNWDPSRTTYNPEVGGPPGQINVANYLAGGRVFGTVISDNITPDPDRGNLPAGLTRAQFIQLIRTGQDPREITYPPHYLQVMPWPFFRNMTDDDLNAIYSFLSAIPHALHGDSAEGVTCAQPH